MEVTASNYSGANSYESEESRSSISESCSTNSRNSSLFGKTKMKRDKLEVYLKFLLNKNDKHIEVKKFNVISKSHIKRMNSRHENIISRGKKVILDTKVSKKVKGRQT
jgi:hypothetical protein